MLLTTCPNCGAKFKVVPEQLNVRQGRVMCGRCRNVFNSFEALKRIEDAADGTVVDYALIDAKQAAAEVAAPLPEKIDAPSSAHPVSATDTSDPLLLVEHTKVDDDVPSHIRAPEAAIPSIAAATDNPLIGSALPRRVPPSGAWVWLVVFAGTALLLQASYFYRSQIVQQYPQLRPALTTACAVMGCTISWGRDQTLIKIESSDLIESPGLPGKLLLTATVANRAATKQDFPVLEVQLTDANNTVLTSRMLMPAEYLGRTPLAEEGLVPNAELYINLNLELVGKSHASGYGLRAFYP